jgi:tRNA1(Val) A37 N6-methylase TrmN6
VATTASLIYEILDSLVLPPETFAFVDMRSGKGRALLVASEFAFATIVGIELSPHLHHIAAENIKRYSPASQRCREFQLLCMNVADYAYTLSRSCCSCLIPLGERRFAASLPIWRRH